MILRLTLALAAILLGGGACEVTLGELIAPHNHSRRLISASAVKTQMVAQNMTVPNGPGTEASASSSASTAPAMTSVNYGSSLQGTVTNPSYGVYNALGMGIGTSYNGGRRNLRGNH